MWGEGEKGERGGGGGGGGRKGTRGETEIEKRERKVATEMS